MSDEPAARAPDWSAITEEILCPLCDYNLRGVAEPRCAECGYRFLWSDMLDPKRRHHPFLFEHHPRHKIWSFFCTVMATWRSWQFWKKLHATQLVFVRRITAYWLLCVSLWLFISLSVWSIGLIVLYIDLSTLPANTPVVWSPTPSISWFTQAYLNRGAATSSMAGASQTLVDWPAMLKFVVFNRYNIVLWLVPTIEVLSWPVVSFLALHAFAITMRKAQIKSGHIWRSVVYSGDVIFWLLLVMILVLVGMRLYAPPGPWDLIKGMSLFGQVAGWLMFAIGTLRLCVAYRYYLTFERPVITVLLAQVIVFLFYVNVAMIHYWVW